MIRKKPVKIKCIKNCKALKIALSKAMLLEIYDMRFKMANEMSIELILNDYCFQLAQLLCIKSNGSMKPNALENKIF